MPCTVPDVCALARVLCECVRACHACACLACVRTPSVYGGSMSALCMHHVCMYVCVHARAYRCACMCTRHVFSTLPSSKHMPSQISSHMLVVIDVVMYVGMYLHLYTRVGCFFVYYVIIQEWMLLSICIIIPGLDAPPECALVSLNASIVGAHASVHA